MPGNKRLTVRAPSAKQSTAGNGVDYLALAEQLKDQVALPDLMARLGHSEYAGVRSGQTIKSPLRGDDTQASFTVTFTGEGYWVYADRGEGGSVIDFVQAHEGLSFKGAVKFLAEMYGGWPDSAGGELSKSPAKQYAPQDWPTCVEKFTEARVKDLARDRGYSQKFCQWLRDKKLIGLHNNAYAFPVRLPERPGTTIRFHVRTAHGWEYFPKEDADGKPLDIPLQPFIIGNPRTAAEVHIFESQWDMFATMDALGWVQGKIREDSAFVCTRGAGNGKLAGAALIHENSRVYVWAQRDTPGSDAKIQSSIWSSTVAKALSDNLLFRVGLPLEAPADQNDWLKQAGDDAPRQFRDAYLRARSWEGDDLPEIISANDLLALPWSRPPQVLHGYLYEGGKMLVQSAPKVGKTWLMINLGLAVAAGVPWLDIKTTQGLVLFLNFEIRDYMFVEDRLKPVARAMGLSPGSYGDLHVWNLRGKAGDFADLLPRIIQRIRTYRYRVVILDPLYMGLGDLDENSAGDMTKLFNMLEEVCQETGAAIVVTHHFSKGNQSSKNALDRGSGSGVMQRNPDCIMTITPQGDEDTDDHFTVEASPRDHAKPQPFVIKWGWPMFNRDADADPSLLKKPAIKGAPSKYDVDQLINVLQDLPDGADTKEWGAACKRELEMSKSTFDRLKKKAEDLKLVHLLLGRWHPTEQPDPSDVPF